MPRRRKSAQEALDAAGEPLHGEAHPPQLNSEARAETIRSVCREVGDLEGQRKAISEEIRSIKQTKIKGDLGMKIGDFNAAFRLYQLEGEGRDTFFDTLRETFRALGVGEQLDFLAAAEAA